ncbi:hypothetical protein MC885_020994 [Smutsia gigantea]|nr:hypothetical protein MC885_020994 [Smutsia gigantea]
MQRKLLNLGDLPIAKCEPRLDKQDQQVMVITQNIDELPCKAGTRNFLEIHGGSFKIQYTSCGVVAESYKSPICQLYLEKVLQNLKFKVPESQ